MAEFDTLDLQFVLDVFLLLVIGVGPKIALVPFLALTKGVDEATAARVRGKMLRTAAVVAAVLIALGEVLARLLHFSTGALGVASGIVLLVIAVRMVLAGDGEQNGSHETVSQDPMRLAASPLAVPYLLNPAGIVALITLSAEPLSAAATAVAFGLLLAVLGIDYVVFRFASRVGDRLDSGRMLVVEKVFGFLLAALAVQLALNGLESVGVIHLNH